MRTLHSLRALGLVSLALGTGSLAMPGLAMERISLDGGETGLRAAARSTGLALDTTRPAKLTLGLDVLAAEYQEHLRAWAEGRESSGGFTSRQTAAWIVGQAVVLDAVAMTDTESLRRELEALGAIVTGVAGRLVSARFPLDRLAELESLPNLRLARPSIAQTHAGSVISQGDRAQYSDLARQRFGVDGTGSVVGVLSDSFNCLGGYATDVSTGDLPAGVNILQDIASGCTDEGRAMAQLVHDVAPGAGLAFHTAWNGQAAFAQGILALADAGSTIIVDDVTYFSEPMFQDGVIAQAVDAVRARGIPYFSSAGNSARQSYESPFRPSGQFIEGEELHDFDPGPGVVTWQKVDFSRAATVTFILQWDQPFYSVSGAPGSASDMDFCISSTPGIDGLVACSTDDNMNGDPLEGFQITANGVATGYLAILHYAGPAPGHLKYSWWGGGVSTEFPTYSPTIIGHHNAAGANAVGAAAFFDTPAFGVNPPALESFSSAGGVPILFDIQGNPVNVARNKPEFTAPDGGNTTFFYVDSTRDEDASPNFFGTSAAAPHAAGVAALLRELAPDLSPGRITRLLQATAIDIPEPVSGLQTRALPGTVGFDNDSGAGLINVVEALDALTGQTIPVPVMPVWGMALLAGMVGGVGISGIRRRG